VISGLTNFDSKLVERVSKAAGLGGATHLDIAADPELVRIAKKNAPHLPVSSNSSRHWHVAARLEPLANPCAFGIILVFKYMP